MKNRSATERTLLFLVFATLGLVLANVFGLADIPWLWVFSPLWLPATVVVVVVTLIALVVADIDRKRWRVRSG